MKVDLMTSPLSLGIAIHYGKYSPGYYAAYDYPGIHFPAQADVIRAFVVSGLLTKNKDRVIGHPGKPKYEATDRLRDMFDMIMDGYAEAILQNLETPYECTTTE